MDQRHRAAAADAAAHRRCGRRAGARRRSPSMRYVEFGLNRTLTVGAERVTIARVSYDTFREYIPVTGNVVPRTTVYLDAVEGGQITAVHVEEGAFVTAGQPLVDVQEHEPRAAGDRRRGAAHGAAQLLEHDAAKLRAEPAAQSARAHRHRVSDRSPVARPRAQAAVARDRRRHEGSARRSRGGAHALSEAASPCGAAAALGRGIRRQPAHAHERGARGAEQKSRDRARQLDQSRRSRRRSTASSRCSRRTRASRKRRGNASAKSTSRTRSRCRRSSTSSISRA